MKTRSQKFAETIHGQVSAARVKSKEYKDEYNSMAQQLPVLIRTSGLAQGLAFFASRGKDACNDLLGQLDGVIYVPQGKGSLVDYSRNAELPEYMRLTRDTLDALLWYKRFAQSVLKLDLATLSSHASNATAPEKVQGGQA